MANPENEHFSILITWSSLRCFISHSNSIKPNANSMIAIMSLTYGPLGEECSVIIRSWCITKNF